MASRERNEPDETAELKQLLFGPELELLDRVRDRAAVLHHRVGDDPALTESVRRVLADALSEADGEGRDRIAAALAPLLLDRVRREVSGEPEMLARTLGPEARGIVGRGLREMSGGFLGALAAPFDWLLSPSRWSARFAAGEGRSVDDVLRQRSGRFLIEQAALIDRATGTLIAATGRFADAESLRALAELAARSELGAATPGVLQDVAVEDGSAMQIAANPTLLLAYKTYGRPPEGLAPAMARALDGLSRRWSEPLARFGGPAFGEAESAALARDIAQDAADIDESRARPYKRRPVAGFAVLSLIFIALLGLGGYWIYGAVRGAEIEDRARALVSSAGWAGYPVAFDYRALTGVLEAQGVAPSPEAAATLKSRLGAIGGVDGVDFRVAAIGAAASAQSPPDDLSARIAALEGRSRTQSALEAETQAALWLARRPIRFLEGDRFADPATSGARLQGVAQLVSGWRGRLTVVAVGYADARERRPAALSLRRAEAVRDALERLGAPPGLVRVVGRGTEKPAGPAGSDENRRVEFEVAWR